jgi:hypothetical protein
MHHHDPDRVRAITSCICWNCTKTTRFVLYSDTLSSQIPTSFAANAFNVFQRGMHQFEIVRLCALWDSWDSRSPMAR